MSKKINFQQLNTTATTSATTMMSGFIADGKNFSLW